MAEFGENILKFSKRIPETTITRSLIT